MTIMTKINLFSSVIRYSCKGREGRRGGGGKGMQNIHVQLRPPCLYHTLGM